MEPIDDINYPGSKHPAKERQHNPVENAVALIILAVLISIPWLTGAAWIALWVYRAVFSHDVSAIGSRIV